MWKKEKERQIAMKLELRKVDSVPEIVKRSPNFYEDTAENKLKCSCCPKSKGWMIPPEVRNEIKIEK